MTPPEIITDDLVQAIVNYKRHPSPYRREIVAQMVREGHLAPAEMQRLIWAMKPYMEPCS